MNGLLNNRKGTTLVEILVVMVILLIGIMSVVMMFPTGFGVVRAAESQTIATKLAQAEVERWKNATGNLPDGILPLKQTTNGLDPSVVDNDMTPGPPFEGFTGTAVPFTHGNVVSFRLVQNEIATIPVASYFTTGGGAVYGSRYTLSFSPIEFPIGGDVDQWVSIKSGDLQRRVGDWESDMWLRRGQYGIDYTITGTGDFHVCFSYDRDSSHEYALSYSYTIANAAGDTQLLSVIDSKVNPSNDGSWVTVTIPTPPTGYAIEDIEEGTDSCARKFTSVSSWSDDPYEFSLPDQILGVVAFNPNTRNMTEYTARGVRPITARVTYRIYDPRIIREDKVIQGLNEDTDNSGTPDHTAVKMALRFILNAGPIDSKGMPVSLTDGDPTDNPDEPTFEGLMKRAPGLPPEHAEDIVVCDSMLIVDLATGLRVSMTGVSIDFKAGVVHLPKTADLIDWEGIPLLDSGGNPTTKDVPLKGRHLRFFYRADGDWSVQVQKAYTYYLRKQDMSRVDYCHFKLKRPASGPAQLLFARCDSGKNVTVDYSYTAADSTVHKVVGRACRISDEWTDDPDIPASTCAYVNLDVPDGATINASSRIVVTGSSFRARVIWRDAKHWRFVDIDTSLTRNSAQ